MKIKIIASLPLEGEAGIRDHIGEIYETIPLETILYEHAVLRLSNLGCVAVNLNDGDYNPSILHRNEYKIIESEEN